MELETRPSRHISVTYILLAANMGVYIFTSLLSGNILTTSDYVLILLGQFNFLVLREGFYYQIFTAMFVHIHIIHLLSNMLFLYIFGTRAEDLFSKAGLLAIYFTSGLAGNLLSLLLPLGTVSAGASGAIFGVLGAVIVGGRIKSNQPILGGLVLAFFFFFISIGVNVNLLAHLGGLLTGLVAGYLMVKRKEAHEYEGFEHSYSI